MVRAREKLAAGPIPAASWRCSDGSGDAPVPGDVPGQAVTLANLGEVHTSLAQYQESAEHLRAAITLFQRAGRQQDEASARNSLGESLRAAGHPTNALDQHRQALAIATTINEHREQARAWAAISTTPNHKEK